MQGGIKLDFYPNLPGSSFSLKDRTNLQNQQTLSGKKIVLIGTALDGPVMEPIAGLSYDDAERLCGSYVDKNGRPNGTNLLKAMKRLLNHGADNIDLLRINGKEAYNELPLYDFVQVTKKHYRENCGEYPGNIETRIDLNIPDGTYIDAVSVIANGAKLTSDKYRVDTSNGIVILYENATDQEAVITVEYTLVTVTVISIAEEEAKCTSSLSGREFILAHNLVISESETVKHIFSDGTEIKLTKDADSNGYTINYDTGLISTTNEVDLDAGEKLVVSYDYQELAEEKKSFNTTALSEVAYEELDYAPDPGEEVIVLANGEEVAKDAYDVNYTYGYVNFKPGYIAKESIIEVVYYWNEVKLTQPKLKFRGFFPGALYNKTVLEVEDVIVETKNETNEAVTGEVDLTADVNVATNYTYYFPEGQRNLVEEEIITISVFDGSGNKIADLVETTDYTIDYNIGAVILTETVYNTNVVTNNYTIKATAYTYIKTEFTKTPKVQNEYLQIVDSQTARFHNDYIVPTTAELVIERDGGTTETLLSTQYTIDYAKGIVKLSGTVLNLGDRIKATKYNYYNVIGKTLKIKKPEEKYLTNSKQPLVFSIGKEIQTIGDLINAIQNHNRNNVVRVEIEPEFMNVQAMDLKTPDVKFKADGSINKTVVNLEFGDDELDLTKEELYDKLGGVVDENGDKVQIGAYDVLMEYEDADIVVPLGVYADDELASNYKNFAKQLTNFIARCFYRSNELKGILGLKPLLNPSRINVINRVKKLRDMKLDFFLQDDNYNYIRDDEGKLVDIGKYLTVVGHDYLYVDDKMNVPEIESGILGYAAVYSGLAVDNAPTNEVVPNAVLAYTYSKQQANELSGARIVTFKNKGGTVRITDGITCAQPNSGWTRDLTMQIVYDVIETVRDVYDKYEGQGNKLEKRNALESELREKLDKKKTLHSFDFNLLMSARDRVIGRMLVELHLVPIGEMKKIDTVVSINSRLN